MPKTAILLLVQTALITFDISLYHGIRLEKSVMCLVSARRLVVIFAASLLGVSVSRPALAQAPAGAGAGAGATATPSVTVISVDTMGSMGAAGIAIDKGILRAYFAIDATGEATRQRMMAAKVALNPQVQAKAKLRKISLQRLEAAIAKQLANGRTPTDEMRYLAGLTRVTNVFFYPETGDIVLAGPAEGWFTDIVGRVVGLHSGRAIVELQDLVTALRAYPPGAGAGPSLIGCSIDATQEGLRDAGLLEVAAASSRREHGHAAVRRAHRQRFAHQPRPAESSHQRHPADHALRSSDGRG